MRHGRSVYGTFLRAAALLAIFGLLLQASAGPNQTPNGAGRCNDNGNGNKNGHKDCGAPPPPPLTCSQQCDANLASCMSGAGGDPALEYICTQQASACHAACP